jgi:hypothetical protein
VIVPSCATHHRIFGAPNICAPKWSSHDQEMGIAVLRFVSRFYRKFGSHSAGFT